MHELVRLSPKQDFRKFAPVPAIRHDSMFASSRVPDPYKAKGVKYQGEVIKRKAGKAFGSGG